MSASATLPVASPAPDPDRGSPDAPSRDAFPRVGRLLGVVRRLVAYGTKLLNTLQQGACAQREALILHAFGTKDLALIIARIKCGLLRAAGLEVRLNGFVKRGRDLQPTPWRMSMPRERKVADAALDANAPSAAEPHARVPGEALALLPSAAEIAEQVRTRPLDAVIGDICRDLGLPPGMMDGALWQELTEALLECGLSLARFLRDSWKPLLGESCREMEFSLSAWMALVDEEMAAPVGQPP